MSLQYINRKSLLYKTGVEYGDYCINHVQGCSHGCLYPCYAMMLGKRFGTVKSYEEWIQPKLVQNAIELLREDIKCTVLTKGVLPIELASLGIKNEVGITLISLPSGIFTSPCNISLVSCIKNVYQLLIEASGNSPVLDAVYSAPYNYIS